VIMGVCERDLRWWYLRDWPELGFYWLRLLQTVGVARRRCAVYCGIADTAARVTLTDPSIARLGPLLTQQVSPSLRSYALRWN
jgi:hypothetical protein